MHNPLVNLEQSPEALDALPADQRQAINLSYFSGFTTEQVSALLDVDIETVEERIRVGLASLAA